MGTRSTIALEFADGTIGQVYCHWDGYLEHNGKILRDHYSDPFKLRDLIDLGDLSSLDANIGTKHDFDARVPGECTFYMRDRNEVDTEARYFTSYQDYLDNYQDEEYNYILRRDGNWYVCGDNGFRLLDKVLKQVA
jgi:hypothetical protein